MSGSIKSPGLILQFPAEITRGLPREQFSAHWRNVANSFLDQIEQDQTCFTEPVAREMAAFLFEKIGEIRALIRRTTQLAGQLAQAQAELVVCHADIHAWNVLIDEHGQLYIVDWDTLMLAPKERDLMFVASGLGGRGHSLEEEERLFYAGYGATAVDPLGLATYRSERIIEDIAVYCEEIFLTDQGGVDRRQALIHLKSIFRPGGVLEIARASDLGASF